jgi:hypothetical protein
MNPFKYSAIEIAIIISEMELGCREENRLIEEIWFGEKRYLEKKYKNNKKKFILDVYYWIHYVYEKSSMDNEFLKLQNEFKKNNRTVDENDYVNDYSQLELFFKKSRIHILYGQGPDYVRIKLRTLLSTYGYKRRSYQIVEHIKFCILVYRFNVTLRDREECDIETCNLDKMLTFRVF